MRNITKRINKKVNDVEKKREFILPNEEIDEDDDEIKELLEQGTDEDDEFISDDKVPFERPKRTKDTINKKSTSSAMEEILKNRANRKSSKKNKGKGDKGKPIKSNELAGRLLYCGFKVNDCTYNDCNGEYEGVDRITFFFERPEHLPKEEQELFEAICDDYFKQLEKGKRITNITRDELDELYLNE